MKKILLMILATVSSSILLYAQELTISGIILDAKTKEPVVNVTVQVEDSKKFTVTNEKGEFLLQTNLNDVLIISHLSYEQRKIIVKQEKNEILLQPKLLNLDNIVIRANSLLDISQSSIIVDNVKAVTQPRNVSDLFRDIQGFGIQKRGNFASEPVFRAFKYEQLNVQFDGGMKVLNACPNRMDPITTHIIPEEIEKIEVIKGPFSVRFGPSFGGIINLVSKKPFLNAKNGFKGSIETGYKTNGSNFSTRGNIAYKSNKFDVSVNGAYRNYGNYEDADDVVVPSSFRTTDYSIKIGFELAKKQRLQISWRQSFSRDIDHAGLPMDSPYDNSYLLGLDYKTTDISDKIYSFSFKGFHSYVDHLMTNDNRPSFMMVEASSDVFATVYGGKTELILTPNDDIFVFTGFDANLISREGDRVRFVKRMNGNFLPQPRTFIDKIWQDAILNNFGGFVESKFKLSDVYTLTAGIRADVIKASINDPEQDFLDLYGDRIEDVTETNIGGNISLAYKSGFFQSQLAIGRGVRTASMVERFINHFSVGVDPYEYVGNPNLDPEVNNQIELSFNKKFENIKLGSSVFYSLLQDHIVPVVDESIPRKFMPNLQPQLAKRFINVDEAVQAGFEFFFNYEVTDDFKFLSDISYTYAQNKDLDEPLPQIAPLTVHVALKYSKERYWLNFNSRFVAAQRRVSQSFMEPETPSFTTFDFSMGIRPFKNLTVGASILNIFDTYYTEHLNFSFKNSDVLSGRIYEPGRNFTFKASYTF